MTSIYTPRFRFTSDGEDHRVRIPIEAFSQRPEPGREASVVAIVDGFYPFVENGEPITPQTTYVRLAGKYYWNRADCGAGCRCDAIMQPPR